MTDSQRIHVRRKLCFLDDMDILCADHPLPAIENRTYDRRRGIPAFIPEAIELHGIIPTRAGQFLLRPGQS